MITLGEIQELQRSHFFSHYKDISKAMAVWNDYESDLARADLTAEGVIFLNLHESSESLDVSLYQLLEHNLIL